MHNPRLVRAAAGAIAVGVAGAEAARRSGLLTPLEGEGVRDSSAAQALGLYKLDAGRQVKGKPVWKHVVTPDRFLAFDAETF